MIYQDAIDVSVASPGSPPGMTASKSSKSSSFKSINSDDGSVLADVSHFEEIGLDDDSPPFDHQQLQDAQIKVLSSPYNPSYSSDLRAARRLASKEAPKETTIELSTARPPLESSVPVIKARPPYPSLQPHVRKASGRSVSVGLGPDSQARLTPFRSFTNRSSGTLPLALRQRSPSPRLSLSPRDPKLVLKPRRSSWQSTRDRKSSVELERECDEDDGDDIPEGLVLDNVPISPRPPQERPKSRGSSLSPSPSPDRQPKERVRSVGNGTPAVASAQGSLRSPPWKSDSALSSANSSSRPGGPVRARVKSWNAALSDLSKEVKALTEKLEEHADEEAQRRKSVSGLPSERSESRPRIKSALPELPPLQRTNIMIDPLPVSKEKEAVLSRTRPSWLPPKDPNEERRHLREYQRMMEQSLEAERRREAAKLAKSTCRDTAADSIMRIWEEDVMPRWNVAIRERRTRELWWHGIAPRSRGIVWSRAIGNELGLSEASYRAALGRAKDVESRVHNGTASTEDLDYASWFDAIRKDVAERSWPDLKIFQLGGPLHQSLVDILSAYAMYRSDIGYVTGCNTIAALLLLNAPNPTTAFVALANVLNRPLPLGFLANDAGSKASAYNLLMQTLEHKSAALHGHLLGLVDGEPELYLCNVFTALFTSHLTLDEATRLWDVYVFEGDVILVRAAVALLLSKEMQLLGTQSGRDVRGILDGDDGQRQRILATEGGEEAWMRLVREAGKA